MLNLVQTAHKIAITATEDGSGIVLTIRDNRESFPGEEAKAHLPWTPGRRNKTKRNSTRYGLPNAMQKITAHGGRIEFENEEGRGTSAGTGSSRCGSRADRSRRGLRSRRRRRASQSVRPNTPMNPTQRTARRTTDADRSEAFTFWFRRRYGDKHVGAWMLRQNEREAQFLTSVSEAPRVGETLELTEPIAADHRPEGHPRPRLPRWGRVLWLEKSAGRTRRVGIRFEHPPQGRLTR